MIINPGLSRRDLPLVDIREFASYVSGSNWSPAIAAAIANIGTRPRVLWFPDGTYGLSSQVAIPSNFAIVGESELTVFDLLTIDINGFSLSSGVKNVHFRNFRITSSITGTAAYKGGINATGASDISARGLTIDNMSFSGIYANECTRVVVEKCKMSDWRGSLSNSADVTLYKCDNSRVFDCDLNGGGWVGVVVQDPDAPGTSTDAKNNIVSFNRIGAHTAYGIIAYENGFANTQNKITKNTIKDITGVNPGNSGGAGIYISNSGGNTVEDNDISNCCISTSNTTLVPGGIGINSPTDVLAEPNIVRGNRINSMAKYSAIRVVNGLGAIIEGNSCYLTVAGTLGITGINASGVIVRGNSLKASAGVTLCHIDFLSVSGALNDLVIAGNTISNAGTQAIRLIASGGTIARASITGNIGSSTGAGYVGISLQSVADVSVNGNVMSTAIPLQLTAATGCAVEGNVLKSNATDAIRASGACTGTKIGYSNVLTGAILDSSTGMNIETGP